MIVLVAMCNTVLRKVNGCGLIAATWAMQLAEVQGQGHWMQAANLARVLSYGTKQHNRLCCLALLYRVG